MALLAPIEDDGAFPGSTQERAVTIGNWDTEEDSKAELDCRIAATGLFRVYPEVTGTLIQPRPGQTDTGMRIDRVLLPTEKLRDLGWKHGAIGVEAKRSGERIGKPLAQATDYVRTSWLLPGSGGIRVELSLAFLWPVAEQYGPVASYMVHQRVGSVDFDGYTRIRFRIGPQTVVRAGLDGKVNLGLQSVQSGRKSGNRG